MRQRIIEVYEFTKVVVYEEDPFPVSEEVKLLAAELDYKPGRRFENVAGYHPITDKQKNYIHRMANDAPSLFGQISRLIREYWGAQTIDEWRKADGMFAIYVLMKATNGGEVIQ